ncbi:hypothetical protein GCM10011309_19980 [Litorimonas cladophorae]|uniref:Uncharacterized protein n=1 Tax=Litorimonas cladophorae TaxID=1220491 RepID=A0A918KNN4_9PROT|nr:hypothetical protein [Litorimonas cladophorae]GGX69955.1 hypothetical protein GCM10011309_19980 [Litorimonas cladophorae]
MLKLLLSSICAVPCILAPIFSQSGFEFGDYATASFDEAYVEPNLNQLDNCKSANLGIFFHENYLESHSAELVRLSLEAAETCNDVEYIIQPISSAKANAQDLEMTAARTHELSQTLEALQVKSTVAEPVKLKNADNLYLNGRTAILKIVIKDEAKA